jgi:predicted outer membrane repeat protein
VRQFAKLQSKQNPLRDSPIVCTLSMEGDMISMNAQGPAQERSDRWKSLLGKVLSARLTGAGATVLFMLIFSVGCEDAPTASDDPPTSVGGPVIRVPADLPTIQAGINAAEDGDTVLVADGVYSGDGNRDIKFDGKQVVLLSENGPAATIIDCGGTDVENHSGLVFISGEDSVVVDGFTIRSGYSNNGGAIRCKSTSPTIANCVLANNHATVSGGAIHCKGTSLRIVNCTMVGNSSVAGGGLLLIAGAVPVMENCIISHSTAGESIYSVDDTSIPILNCCLIYGNAGGDWVDPISDQAGINGNLNEDPLFCNPSSGDFRLQPDSPCLPGNNSCGVPVGALSETCP